MSAIDPLFHLTGVDVSTLTPQEKFLLELELFSRICEELKEIFRERHRSYFNLMKFSIEKEDHMLESQYIQFIINDILSTGEYNLKGIACYTNTFEDVVMESMAGINKSPSAMFLRKLIDLHRSVRRDLYDLVMKRIVEKISRDDGGSNKEKGCRF
jgi:hypothetical protein